MFIERRDTVLLYDNWDNLIISNFKDLLQKYSNRYGNKELVPGLCINTNMPSMNKSAQAQNQHQQQQQQQQTVALRAISVSEDHRYITAANSDGFVYLWETKENNLKRIIQLPYSAKSAKQISFMYHPDIINSNRYVCVNVCMLYIYIFICIYILCIYVMLSMYVCYIMYVCMYVILSMYACMYACM